MNKRAFVIRGWDGFPDEGWFPWLKKELEQNGFSVVKMSMHTEDDERKTNWLCYFVKVQN